MLSEIMTFQLIEAGVLESRLCICDIQVDPPIFPSLAGRVLEPH